MVPFDESHVDDDLLALLALGEPVGSTADLAHIEECERCTDELTSLRDVVGLARSGGADAPLVAPAPQVWDRIAAELGLAAARRDRPRAVAPARRRRRQPSAPSAPPSARLVGAGRRRPGRPARLATRSCRALDRRGGRGRPGGRWRRDVVDRQPARRRDRDRHRRPGAAARLGRVRVRRRRDPVRRFARARGGPRPGRVVRRGFREVWLLKPDVSGLVSVGTLDGSSGRFDLPAGLDLEPVLGGRRVRGAVRRRPRPLRRLDRARPARGLSSGSMRNAPSRGRGRSRVLGQTAGGAAGGCCCWTGWTGTTGWTG